MLDIDVAERQAFDSVSAHLAAGHVPTYVNRSSTGRGWHLFVPLTTPVPADRGAILAKHLALAAKTLTPRMPHRIEHYPTSRSDSGSMVLLPYRGASTDGYGFNPLLDPENDDPIRLDRVDRLMRADADALSKVLSSIVAAPTPSRTTATERREPLIVGEPVDRARLVREEAERIARHWSPGGRQDLVAGFVGFMALHGVPEAEARSQVRALSRQGGDTPLETSQRLTAVHNTYKRLADGALVAYRLFYERVGLEPPTAVRAVPVGPINAVLQRAFDHKWAGNGGFTDLGVLLALAHFMYRYGRLVEPGVAHVGVAVRSLAAESNTSPLTVSRSLKRLAASGFIERVDRAGPKHQAYRYAFIARPGAAPPTPPQSLRRRPYLDLQVEATVLEDCVGIYCHPAFHAHGLGPKAAWVALLLYLAGPLTEPDLRAFVTSDVSRPLERLVDAGAVWHTDERFELVDTWRAALDAIAVLAGTSHKRRNKNTRIRQERALFNFQHGRGER